MNKIIIILLLVILSINLGCQCDSFENSYISYDKYDDADKFNVGSIKYSDNIDTLNMNWKAGNVKIIKSTDNSISIEESNELEEKQKVRTIVKNGELIIHFWDSGFTSKVKSEKKNIKVYVPEGINIYISSTSAEVYNNIRKAKNVDINTTSGNIKLDNLECDNLSLSSTSGEIETAKIEASYINLSSTSGEIEAKSLKADNIICSSTSGEIEIDELYTQICELKSTSGSISVGNNTAEKLNIQSTSGGVKVFLDESKEYNLKTTSGGVKLGILSSSSGKILFKTSSGSFKTSGMKVLFDGTYYQIGNQERNITVDTKSGSLKLYEVK